MKVIVKKIVKNNVGVTVNDAFEQAREIASTISHFRVRLWQTGRVTPRAWWSWELDDISDIRPIFNKDEYDVIEVSDDDTGKAVTTILVND